MAILISEEESDALEKVQGHLEISTPRWRRLKKRLLIRNSFLVLILSVRATAMIFLPESYLKAVFPFLEETVDLAQLAYSRIIVAAVFLSIYLYALRTNHYLRSASMLGLLVGVALLWSDISQYLVFGWHVVSIPALVGFCSRFLVVIILVVNYLDVRR